MEGPDLHVKGDSGRKMHDHDAAQLMVEDIGVGSIYAGSLRHGVSIDVILCLANNEVNHMLTSSACFPLA